MSNTSGKAEEVLSKKQGTRSTQRWAHDSLNDGGGFGAHWNSRKSKQNSHNSPDGHGQETSQALKQDRELRNQDDKSLQKSEVRPRSKNRRPDVAVYVPRGRRGQQSTQNEVSQEKDASADQWADSAMKDKTNRIKGGMGVYVPRPKRLQQSADMNRDEQDVEAEPCNDNSVEEKAGARTSKSKKIKKHVHKEQTSHSEDIDVPGDSSKRKHNHPKSSKHGRHLAEGEKITDRKLEEINRVTDVQNVHVSAGDTAASNVVQSADVDNVGDVDCKETWDDEMKFYDSVDKVVESAGEIVENSPECLDDSAGNHSTMIVEQEVPMKEETIEKVEKNVPPEKNNTEISTQNNGDVPSSEIPPSEGTDGDSSSEKPSKQRRTSGEDTELNDKQGCVQVPAVPRNLDNENNSLKIYESGDHGVQSDGAKTQSTLSTLSTQEASAVGESVDDARSSDPPKSDIVVDVISIPVDTATPECANKQESHDAQTPEPSQGNNANAVAMETEEDGDGDTWDSLFADDGEALDPKLMDELTAAVGKVTVQKPQFDYYNYQPKDPDLDDEAYGHLVEIYDFPSELLTRDLVVAFKEYKDRGFDIKWVDDNHAIGIFSSSIAAQSVLGMKHPLMKVRPISQASRETKVKAKKCGSFMEPYRPRPETTAAVARSLVTGALGLKSNLTREQRDAERRKLKEAKEKRRNERQQKKDAWDGSYGKCAMDD